MGNWFTPNECVKERYLPPAESADLTSNFGSFGDSYVKAVEDWSILSDRNLVQRI